MILSKRLYNKFYLIFPLILILFSTVSAQDSLQNENAVKKLKESGQYDSLMDAFKKAQGEEIPTSDLAVGQTIRLLASDGATGDRFSESVALDGDTAVVGSPNDDLLRGSAYVFVRSGTVWTQQVKLTASDGLAGDRFGGSVAVNGDTIAVGANQDDVDSLNDNRGSVYIFTRVAGVWIEQTKLFANDRQNNDFFGSSVALSGGTLVIGAFGVVVAGNANQGAAYVYVGAGPIWIEQAKLTASDGATDDSFGQAVAINGNTIVVGAIFDDIGANTDQGSAYVFVGGGTVWNEQVKLINPANEAVSSFGFSVAISGDTIVVGAVADTVVASQQGTATVFTRSGTVWSIEQTLTAAAPTPNERFGDSVGISGNTIVVGASQTVVSNTSGSAYLFTRSGTVWTQQNQFTPSDSSFIHTFGATAAISGNYILVGSPNSTVQVNTTQGSAYIFRVLNNTWDEEAFLFASDGDTGDFFGLSVAISGETAVIGAGTDDVNSELGQGSAYVFVRSGTSWVQQAKLTANDGQADDFFGVSVAIHGDNIVVGASANDLFGNSDQGSAYIYSRVGTVWVEQDQFIAPDGAIGDRFGESVDIFADTAVIAAPNDNYLGNAAQGSAYVYRKSGASWNFEAHLTASDGLLGDTFGWDVAIYGNQIIVGVPLDDVGATTDQGSAYLFKRVATTWTEQTRIIAADGASGDRFGDKVSISGNTAIVSAGSDTVGGNVLQGSVYVFTGSGFLWTQQAKLVDSEGAANDLFGRDIEIDGDTIIIGNDTDNPIVPGLRPNSFFIFERTGTIWTLKQKITRGDSGSVFAHSVAISGDKIIVGDFNASPPSLLPRSNGDKQNLFPPNQGGVYFFINSPLVPTAANVTIGGRVLTSNGRGFGNAQVSLTDTEGNTKIARTSTFGYFNFDEVESGKTYILSVNAKRFRYTPKVLSLNESVTDLIFLPE